MKKLITTLTLVAVLLCLVSPVMGIDHPVEPFQRAKALALMEGDLREDETGKVYILLIEGWGAIMCGIESEDITLYKGTPGDHSGVSYDGKHREYRVSRVIKRGKPEIMFIDSSVAMDIAYKYLREIEEVRRSK